MTLWIDSTGLWALPTFGLSVVLCILACSFGRAFRQRRSQLRSVQAEDRRHMAAIEAQDAAVESAVLSLPRTVLDERVDGGRMEDCVVYLLPFKHGDEVRRLPPCGHQFHVDCKRTAV